MSSKKKKSEGRSGDSVEQAAEIFQAVILSDSFNFRFLPITLETPRVSLFWLFFIITYFLNLNLVIDVMTLVCRVTRRLITAFSD